MGGDLVMIITLLYIVMVVLAFVFAVTTRSTIEKEASTIGTLRALGYTRGELIRHYLTLPIRVTLISAVIGNILGYTCMKDVVVDIYYHSYPPSNLTNESNPAPLLADDPRTFFVCFFCGRPFNLSFHDASAAVAVFTS